MLKLLLLFPAVLQYLQSFANAVSIKVDVAKDEGALPQFFLGTGFTPSSLLLKEEGRLNMLMAGGGGYKYMRVHCMLDLVDISGKSNDVYNWTLLDLAFDAILEAGLTPIVNLNGNPTGSLHKLFLDHDFLFSDKLYRWRDLIEKLGRHLVAQYGNSTYNWFFEHWNEPMTIDKFCADGSKTPAFGSYQSMFNYYDACENGLAHADQHLKIGGPTTHSSVSATSDIIVKFLEHCDSGQNVFSNSTGTRLDFISIHRKGTEKHDEGNSSKILDGERGFFKLIREKHPKFKDLPFFNDEADPISGWSKKLAWRPGPTYAAFMVKVIAQHFAAMDASTPPRIDGVPYALLSNDNAFTGGWLERTLLTTFHKNSSDMYAVVKKPDLTVMGLLSRLGQRRVHLQVSGNTSVTHIGGIASLGDVCVSIILFRSDDTKLTSGKELNISLDVVGISGNVTVAHWRLDGTHGNPYGAWKKLGSPTWPSITQLEALELAQEPILLGVQSMGMLRNMSFSLPLPSISLVQFCHMPSQAPPAPSKPSILKKQQHDGTVIYWQPLISANVVLRTYELECSTSGGAYKRVNEADILASAWIYHHGDDSKKRCYRIRAVDYWGRSSPASNFICDGIAALA